MGQYYNIAIKNCESGKIILNDREVENHEYIMAKLMEHSWQKNPVILAVAKMLYKHQHQLAWVGDYAEENEVSHFTNNEFTYGEIWDGDAITSANVVHEPFKQVKSFSFKGKCLVNHSKKVYISFDEYTEKSKDGVWCLSPISLMTAIGNGRGGGDYGSVNAEHVGEWAWDVISIENLDNDILGDYKKVNIYFNSSF